MATFRRLTEFAFKRFVYSDGESMCPVYPKKTPLNFLQIGTKKFNKESGSLKITTRFHENRNKRS